MSRLKGRPRKLSLSRRRRGSLETRHGIGGESFIRLSDDEAVDHELYIRLYKGADEITSPDVGLDTVVDFIAQAANVIPRLIAEMRRLGRLQT